MADPSTQAAPSPAEGNRRARPEQPQLSIIIVNYRGWTDLANCLDSLLPLSRPGSRPETEVIVVDNASGDDRLDDFANRYPWVNFLLNEDNLGFASGCNLGAGHARGSELLFLNPDARDPGGQISRFWLLLKQHPETAILTVRQLDELGRGQKVFDAFPGLLNLYGPLRSILRRLLPSRHADARHCHDPWREVDWVSGSALMIRATAFRSLQGWSENYWMYFEDVDLCRRARNASLPVAFSAQARLEHRHGGTSRRNIDTAALTRSEVVMSRHAYAQRHFSHSKALLYHLLLANARLPGPVLARGLVRLIPGLPSVIQVRSRMLSHLMGFYRDALRGRGWSSPRAPLNRKARQRGSS